MDALSNPNAFRDEQAKKDEKMKELGIQESAASKAATTGGKVNEEVKRGWYIFTLHLELSFLFDLSNADWSPDIVSEFDLCTNVFIWLITFFNDCTVHY